MKILYLDCRQGVSGDMMLAALSNLTGGRDVLEAGLKRLGLDCFRLSYPKRKRGGVEADGIVVEVEKNVPRFRNVEEILSFLSNTGIAPEVRKRAEKVFRMIAEGEAAAHEVAAGYSDFHEVGSVDAIVDVVGSSVLLELVGADEVVVSPLRLGFGNVKASHGSLPIPAPATAAILEGLPVFAGDVEGEFTTPTGAALVKAFTNRFGPIPEMILGKSGYGPGSADPPEFPNALVAYTGEIKEDERERVAVIETNLDDITGEALAYAVGLLFEAGAIDVFTAPIYMKKSRPGTLLTVLTDPTKLDEFTELILRHTSTLGVRYRIEDRKVLPREIIEVETEYGAGKVKIGRLPDGTFKLCPEYSSVSELADQANITLTDAYECLASAAKRSLGQ
jgi:uncharacterized protein (TIGR00299 family) protein